jgi:uncharacterized small protein (DUF1192 family)
VADGSGNQPDQITGHRLDDAMRERLLEVLRSELTLASRDALARGMSPEELSDQLDERIARLRAQIAKLSAEDT